MVVGAYGKIGRSTNGETWTEETSGTFDTLYDVGSNGAQFVAVGESGRILSTPSGAGWTSRVSGTADELHGVAWGASRFVVVKFVDGLTSHGELLLAQSNQATLEEDGVDVTEQIAVRPAP